MRTVDSNKMVLTYDESVAQRIDGLQIGNRRIEVVRDFDGKPIIGSQILDETNHFFEILSSEYPMATPDQIKEKFTLIPFVYDNEL